MSKYTTGSRRARGGSYVGYSPSLSAYSEEYISPNGSSSTNGVRSMLLIR